MTLSYGQDVFSLNPGQSISLRTVFNSSNFDAGGDFMGPMVVIPVQVWTFQAGETPNSIMTPSTVGVEFTGKHTSQFTTNCIYHYDIRNDSPNAVSFKIVFFYD